MQRNGVLEDKSRCVERSKPEEKTRGVYSLIHRLTMWGRRLQTLDIDYRAVL